MAAMSRLLTSFGNEGCQCVDNAGILASLSGRICQLPNGDDGVRIDLDGSCVPFSYGSSQCLNHDLLHNAACQIDDLGKSVLPDWCYRPWCYVDATSCSRDSGERAFRTDMFPANLDLFYSYSTCGSTADAWAAHTTDNLLGGEAIKAVFPTYFPPSIFKRDPNDPKNEMITSGNKYYYNNSVPWEGVYVDYMQSLQEISKGDIGVISQTHRSRASSIVHDASTFTAAVQDVADGLADMAIGPFWITAERLRLTQFTVPIVNDKVHLVVPKQGLEESLGQQFLKATSPFKPGLWAVIIATIVFASLLHVWLSDPFRVGGSSRSRRGSIRLQAQQGQGESNRERRKKTPYLLLFIDDLLEKGQEFAGAAVGFEYGASLPVKLLDFGFSFFVLVAVSTYVANLAAVLTRSMISESKTSMRGAVAANYKICAHPVIEVQLAKAWPNADFYFHKDEKEYRGMLEDYDAGKCRVLLIGWEDASMDEELLQGICDRDLIFTESIVLEIPIGFPLSSELSKGLSYWMYKGSKFHEVSFQQAKEDYLDEHSFDISCNVELSAVDSEDSDYIQIEIKNLALPLVLFSFFALLAVILHVVNMTRAKKNAPMVSDANAALEDWEEDEDNILPKDYEGPPSDDRTNQNNELGCSAEF